MAASAAAASARISLAFSATSWRAHCREMQRQNGLRLLCFRSWFGVRILFSGLCRRDSGPDFTPLSSQWLAHMANALCDEGGVGESVPDFMQEHPDIRLDVGTSDVQYIIRFNVQGIQ